MEGLETNGTVWAEWSAGCCCYRMRIFVIRNFYVGVTERSLSWWSGMLSRDPGLKRGRFI